MPTPGYVRKTPGTSSLVIAGNWQSRFVPKDPSTRKLIIQVCSGEPISPARAGVRTLLEGAAFDDRRRELRGRALTWYAGSKRLGTGKRLATKLPPGRITLRLVARDRAGRRGVARRKLRVAPQPLRLLRFSYPERIRRRDRAISVRVSASAPATLRAVGRRYRLGPTTRRISIRLPKRPVAGLLGVSFTITLRGRGAGGTVRGRIGVVRVAGSASSGTRSAIPA